MIAQIKSKIVYNKKIALGYYKMRIAASQIAKIALPGQFINIKVNDTYKPLLRKPLGIYSVTKDKKSIEILYKVVGEGTKILSEKKKGDYLDVLGPLGNGFDYSPLDFARDGSRDGELVEPMLDTGYSILVAGGIGVAPLVFLAEKLVHSPIVLIGARTKSHILCEKEFKGLGCEVKVATDDGTRGFKGSVTELLEYTVATSLRSQVSGQKLATCNMQHVTIYTCGPKLMLKATAEISKKFMIPCFGLLEEYMACGTGACFGCAVLTKSGYKRVCKDGPVFDLNIIEW